MFKTLALAGAAALAFASVSAAQPRGDMGGSAHDFVSKAGASDKFEITEGQMAATRAHDPALRRFGSMMVKDHTKSTMKVKAAARQSMGHNPPPPMLMPEQQSMIAELRNAHGADFDRTYVQQQMQAHQMALDLMSGYASNGSDPALRRAASEIQPVVQHHIEMLRDMQGRMH